MTRTIGIIGVGEIAGAIVDGLCDGPGTSPEVYLSPRGATIAADLAARHRTVQVCADNQAVVDRAQILIIAVRPDIVDEVLSQLRVPDDRLVISVIAGVSHDELRRGLGERVTIVRTIPLPPVRERKGITAVYPAHPDVEELFDALGGTVVVADVDGLTAFQTASATMSAHLAYLAHIVAWLGERGIPPEAAESYVRGLFSGLADGLADRTRTLSELLVGHETPGGFNEQLRQAWFTEQNRAALGDALDAVYARLAGPEVQR